jgi:hypothetical protein
MLTNMAAAVASGIAAGVLVWAVQTRLADAVRTMRARHAPGPECAHFDPAAANLIVLLDCGQCARHTPHEDDQHGTARCVACGTERPAGEVPADGY